MIVALYIFLALVAVGTLLWLTDRRKADSSRLSEPQPESECCGLHAVCEKTARTALNDTPEYFDDEELDLFAGRDENNYSDTEIEQFREVMLTLQPSEVIEWSRSLELRGIAFPIALRDELLMLI